MSGKHLRVDSLGDLKFYGLVVVALLVWFPLKLGDAILRGRHCRRPKVRRGLS